MTYPIDDARNQISYNPETGLFFWKRRDEKDFKTRRSFSTWNARYAGLPAGTINNHGYIVISLKAKKRVLAHRLAWALYYGEWPENDIDHINGVRLDNRINNLRAVTRAENLKNVKKKRNNSSGCMGVSWNAQTSKWRVRIHDNGKEIPLGCFVDKASAIQARKRAELAFGYHENHGRS